MDATAKVLAEKRARLESELARMTAPPDDTGAISFGKRVGDGTSMAVDRLVDVAAHDKIHAVLAVVLRAQKKQSEGTYGICDNCGSEIARERLEALPWAVLCVRCAGRR